MNTPYSWRITYDRFEPEEEGLRETLCALGNGYFAVRGAAPEAVTSKAHYPGTYIAGLYNKLATRISGRSVVNEDFVNCPNWIFLTFRIGDGEWFCPSTSKVVSFCQELDMQKGVLHRKIIFQDWKGQKTLIQTSMIVHMDNPHIGAIRYVITPKNYSDWLTVGSMLDAAILNAGVERYKTLSSRHLRPSSLGRFGTNGVYLSMRTSQSKIEVAEAAKLRIFKGRKEITPSVKTVQKGREIIGQEFKIFARKNKSYDIEKTVSIYTSKDKGIRYPLQAAIKSARFAHRFKLLFLSHKRAWEQLWRRADIQIKGDSFSQKMLRLHIFHLLQVASIHNADIDAGLPARGLHGEAYRGHVFWDEIFVLPFYNLHSPEISKALLLYRYRRLPAARTYAGQNKYRGSMFPWQSGSSGKEETQVIHLNPLSGKWGPDYSHTQRHVSFAIAYNVWDYYKKTGDSDFLYRYGAELILSIAQFGGSLTRYSTRDKRFHTQGVMGPDEFHEKYPGSHNPGLKDNAYTNFMIVWTLLRAKEILTLLPRDLKKKLLGKLRIREKEIQLWDTITRKMNILINDKGIISQFEGYFKLKELNWDIYRARYRNIHRMDRILKAEGKSPDAYKVSKQADVLMIFYLFTFPEIAAIFKRLGYGFDRDKLSRNYEYYVKRTSHGSSLSKVAHCYVAHQLDKFNDSWNWFIEVLESDFYDTQGGTTPEGIHIGIMGGSIDIVLRGFAGINVSRDRISINPSLPKEWRRIRLNLLYKNKWIFLTLTKSQVKIFIRGPRGKSCPFHVEINGRVYCFLLGKTYRVLLKK